MKPYDASVYLRVAELRKQGWSIAEVAEELGVSETTVCKGCKMHSVTRSNGYSAKPKRTKPTGSGMQYRPEVITTDWWPMVPQYIRLTERGRSQRVPRAMGV